MNETHGPAGGWAALLALILSVSAHASSALYVDDDAPAGGDGSGWSSPLTDLQSALDIAAPTTTVYIAGGRYTPDVGNGRLAGDRNQSFRVPSGVALRGGYAGVGAPNPAARNAALYPTVLSGDLLGDDVGIFEGNADNSLHVVIVSNTGPSTLLEDLIISGGNADGPTNQSQVGAGVLGFGASATFVRCTISGNIAAFQGGGVQLKNGSEARFVDCTFAGNRALDNGGALYNGESSPTLDHCTFVNNSGRLYAGAICNRDNSDALIIGCTFMGNSAAEADPLTGGGAIVNASSSPRILSCTFIENTANVGRGGAIYNKFGDNPALGVSAPTVEQCVFQNNTAFLAGAFYSDDLSESTITACLFSGNVANDGDGGAIWATGGTTTIDLSAFLGNSAHTGGAIWNDLGTSSITNCMFMDNEAGNGGAIFNNRCPAVIRECTFTANHADTDLGGGAIWNEQSSAFVDTCSFIGNTGDSGGAVYNVFGSDAIYTNCLFRGNAAVSTIFGVGGAMGTYESSPLVLGCTFIGNFAPLAGGAIYNENIVNGRGHYVNCTIVANVADSMGGGAYNFFSRPMYTNCTFADNRLVVETADGAIGGAMVTHVDAPALVINCVIWGNDAEPFGGLDADVRFSCVEGGYPGYGNFDVDPAFVQAAQPGPDGQWATDDDVPGDYRLQAGSTCIDRGDHRALPADRADLDGDGDVRERTPVDHAGAARFVDDPVADGDTCPVTGTVDLGAFEFQAGTAIATMRVGDVDGDGIVDAMDLMAIIREWGTCPDDCCAADVDATGVVDALDLLALIADWGR